MAPPDPRQYTCEYAPRLLARSEMLVGNWRSRLLSSRVRFGWLHGSRPMRPHPASRLPGTRT